MIKTVTVRVPATTANLGPGFDCVGAALSLHNQFQFSLLESATPATVNIEVSGAEADRVKTDESNLAYQAFVKLYEHLNQPVPPVQITIQLEVPLARGLGSSATAIVGGLIGANLLAQSPLDRDAVMQLAIAIEGHPDNVVPALIGGCRLSAFSTAGDWMISDIPWHEDLVPVVAIPNFELSTAEARRVLPTQYSRADAIFNVAHLGLLVRGLETGRADWLQTALHDRIHQPYRQSLIVGYEAVHSAAMAAGAYGLVISGAGPTLLALANSAQANGVETAITEAWRSHGIAVDVRSLQIDTYGASIHLQD
ncbi:homoserine kinase [Oculatella sp. LEGE 06141]|uniref:homoserine kinase n=1 Tax=Oculatella sp. LEGE 06141 TaxID=1828648 RepID=UPI00187E7B15|nr:homoserine kinase [Oculatella sp. LEGE 06141]MBE9177216.1 homoserine kinase [Oculatella sp. LEGE 06141]